jgi:hypothetical protein
MKKNFKAICLMLAVIMMVLMVTPVMAIEDTIVNKLLIDEAIACCDNKHDAHFDEEEIMPMSILCLFGHDWSNWSQADNPYSCGTHKYNCSNLVTRKRICWRSSCSAYETEVLWDLSTSCK